MRSLVVYYSYDGHSTFVANELAKTLNAPIFRIETLDEKRRTGLAKYVWGGKMVFSKQYPRLKPFNLDISQYDLIVLGGPVWAGSPAPPLLSFLRETEIRGKQLALFLCHAGGLGKALDKLKTALAGNTIAGEIALKNPSLLTINDWGKTLTDWAAKISGSKT